tara:strand:+ start:1952 stop:2806 length:855 start_codon:yes stop_codon:yes gene_type:complete
MLLILDDGLHFKNKEGLIKMLEYLKIKYTVGTHVHIKDCDVIYSPSNPIDASLYPNKKFIFGPHFSTFPNEKVVNIKNTHNNCVYIQPSEWVYQLWKSFSIVQHIPLQVFNFPVNTEKFAPNKSFDERSRVFIYFKRRKPEELDFVIRFCKRKNILPQVFDYVKRYDEQEYLDCLQNSSFGIILDAHESQGFAIEEALSCDVPLLVWNVKTMDQEHGSSYQKIPCTSIPYWNNDECGNMFYERDELETAFHMLIKNLPLYTPRQYILENVSVEKCAQRLETLIR